ncbi:MAG TPA: GAF domain-containing SpoIIE family protein phosphatase [Bacteroidota bacterium]|nr:GAF domain-containing SpoIIE family protein phosphatase [Bacteroidota bacterium]
MSRPPLKPSSHSKITDRLADITPLFEFSNVVNSSLDLKFILGTVLLTLMGKLLLSKSVVLIRTKEKHFRIENSKGIPLGLASEDFHFPRLLRRSYLLTRSAGTDEVRLLNSGIERMFPIVSHGTVLGFFGIGKRAGNGRLTAAEKSFVEAIISISAAAIEKSIAFDEIKSVNRRLDGKVQELRTLFELSKEFNAIFDRDKLLKLLAFTLMGQVGAGRYAVCLRNGETVASRVETSRLAEFKEVMFEHVSSPVLVNDLQRKKDLLSLRAACQGQGIVALVPLEVQNEVKGMMCLGERLRGGAYSESDLEFIYSLGNLAIISLENTRLFYEAVEKQKLENELNIAREIQKGLLPRTLPKIPGLELAALNISSEQVGGDYYDIVPLDNGNCVIAIGDVSGKGTPASLLMANVQAIIRTLVQFDLPLSEMTSRVNTLICENTGSDKFITFFWGIFDPKTRTFRYVNAGHNHPFIVRANRTIERLTEGGIILGVMKETVPYKEGSVVLSKGDAVVMFTDGISEAMNVEGVDYTEEKVEEFLKNMRSLSAQEVLGEIQNEIARYTSGAPQSDDITLVVMKWVG